MRVYKLKNFATDDFLIGIGRALVQKKGKKIQTKEYEYVPLWSTESNFMPVENMNTIIEDAIKKGLSSALSDVEIVTFETREPRKITSNLKIENIKRRFEAQEIMAKLKGETVNT